MAASTASAQGDRSKDVEHRCVYRLLTARYAKYVNLLRRDVSCFASTDLYRRMSAPKITLAFLLVSYSASPGPQKNHQQTVHKANLKVPRPDVERRRLERPQQFRLRPRFYQFMPEEVARRRDLALVEGHVRAGGRR